MKTAHVFSLLCLFGLNALWAKPVFPPEYNLPDEKLLLGIALNDLERVDAAFEAGAQLDAQFGAGRYYTPLQLAIVMGRTTIINDLLKRGSKVEHPGEVKEGGKVFAESAMILAASHKHLDILSLLIPEVRKLGKGKTIMFRTSFERALAGGDLDIARLLVDAGFDPKTGLLSGETDPEIDERPYKLIEAVEDGDPAVVKYLVEECGFSPNQGIDSKYDGSPVFVAVRWGNVEVLRYLIDKGADFNTPSPGTYSFSGYSPLALALRYGRVECANVLLDAGASISAKDAKHSPILQADLAGYNELLERFEARGEKSELWEMWQKASDAADASVAVSRLETRTDLSAQLLEGQWPSPSGRPIDPANKQPIRVCILATGESEALADLLAAEASDLPSVELVERGELDRIIQENQLNRAALMRGENLSAFSQLLAADALIIITPEKVDRDQLHRFRWIDARRGLLLSVRYAPGKQKSWPEFTKRYRDYIAHAAKKLKGADEKEIPISVTGVHANRATPGATLLERETALALQFALSKQDPFLLLERQSLQRLAAENAIAGETSHGFQGSGIFLSARTDVDVATGELRQIVIQATRPDGSEVAVLRREASRDALFSTCRGLVAELREVVNAETGISGDELAQSATANDAKELVGEAYWLYRNGLHQQAYGVMQNALVLGANSSVDWKLNLAILDEVAEHIRNSRTLSDEKFRELLRIELERMRSMELYIDALRRGHKKGLKMKGLSDVDDIIEGFSITLHHMRAVTLQRRYRAELMDLQHRFVRIFNNAIGPIISGGEPKLSKHFPRSNQRNLRNACLWLLPRLCFQDEKTIESILATTLVGDHEAYWRYMAAPSPRLGSFSALDTWINEHGNRPTIMRYYAERADAQSAFYDPLERGLPTRSPLRRTNARGEIRTSNWNARKLFQKRDLALGESPSDALAQSRPGKNDPLYSTWTVKDQTLECRTIEAQRLDAARFQENASHQDEQIYMQTLPTFRNRTLNRADSFKKYTDLESARLKLTSGRALIERIRSKPDADQNFISEYETFLTALSERVAVLDGGSDVKNVQAESISATHWHYSDFLPEAANDLWFYPVNQGESLLYHDEAWWAFGLPAGLIRNEGHQVAVFRIDDHALETEVKRFSIPNNVRLTNLEVEFILISGQNIVIGNNTEHGTLVLDWLSGESSFVRGFKACYFSKGSNWLKMIAHEGKIYYTAVPDYERDPYRARRNSLVFLELDPVTLQQKVLFNFRRNPLETPLDKPIESKYSNKGFKIRFSEPEGRFAFIHSGERYAFDPDTSEFAEISAGAFQQIDRTALKIVNTWPMRDGKSNWSPQYNDGPEDLDLGDAIPLVLIDRKNKNAEAVVGLEFRNAPGVNTTPSDSFKAEIRSRKHGLRLYGYSKRHAVLVPANQGIAFIKYEALEQALEE